MLITFLGEEPVFGSSRDVQHDDALGQGSANVDINVSLYVAHYDYGVDTQLENTMPPTDLVLVVRRNPPQDTYTGRELDWVDDNSSTVPQ